MLARGERIENLVDKTDNLRTQADRFHRCVSVRSQRRQSTICLSMCPWYMRHAGECTQTLMMILSVGEQDRSGVAAQDVVAAQEDVAHHHHHHSHSCACHLPQRLSRRWGQLLQELMLQGCLITPLFWRARVGSKRGYAQHARESAGACAVSRILKCRVQDGNA